MKGDQRNTSQLELTQGEDKEVEGGGEGQGGSNLSSEEAQWEDITNMGEDKATGREAKEAKSTPRGNSCVQGRTKPSPRRNKRGFWLERRDKLLRPALKKKQMD